MKGTYKKKLEKAAAFIREVFNDLEAEESEDFDEYGTRLEDLAGEIEDILLKVDGQSLADDEDADDDDGYQVE